MSPCPAQETKADALTWCPGQRRIRGARVEAEGPRHPGSSPTPPAFSVSCGQQAALTLSNQPYREETGTASTTDLAPPGRLWPLKKICLKCRATERRQSELSSPSLLPKRLSQDEARSLGAPTRLSLTGLGPKHWVLELELIQTLRDPALPCTATVGSSCKDSEPVPFKSLAVSAGARPSMSPRFQMGASSSPGGSISHSTPCLWPEGSSKLHPGSYGHLRSDPADGQPLSPSLCNSDFLFCF